jgi:aspartate 1-decarboxylase
MDGTAVRLYLVPTSSRQALVCTCKNVRSSRKGSDEMQLKMLQAKLHRVRLTEADLNYEGSCGIDELLLEASGIRAFQHIEIYNISNGARFTTYAIRAGRDSGMISLNGAAARQGMPGDLLIIAAYAHFTLAELASHEPRLVFVDERNRPRPIAPR